MSTTRELEVTLGAALADLQAAERERDSWKRWSGPAVLIAMVVAFLFGVWLAGKVNTPPCPAPRIDAGPATELGTTATSEPNMMTVSIVHRFRHQNKG